MIQCAVVGLGIGLAHCAGYLASPHAKLYAVCDLMPERLSAVRGTFRQGSMLVLKSLIGDHEIPERWEDLGVKVYDSYDRLLEDEGVHCISLCTPDDTHADLAVKALEAGKHLLLEKPVDITLEKAERVRAAAEKAGTYLSLGYEFRVNPVVMRLRELVETGALGDIQGFSLYHYRTPFKRDKFEKWIQKKSRSGGLLVEETCHWFDLARFVTGKDISSVHCVRTADIHPDFDFEDLAYVNGTFSGGGIFQISHALTGFDFSLVINLHGMKGTAWAGLKENARSSLDNFSTSYYGILATGSLNAGPEEAAVTTWGIEATEPLNIRDMVMAFVESIHTGTPVPCSLEEGIASLAAALAAGRSADERRIVEL
ncbi:MAG: Gfo/Idh/MocA family oxidoreductase [Spirochaetales bacterium]|nr:Gfo/Idh/MocA family oxidoreductase [Spirochaetales bacterium]